MKWLLLVGILATIASFLGAHSLFHNQYSSTNATDALSSVNIQPELPSNLAYRNNAPAVLATSSQNSPTGEIIGIWAASASGHSHTIEFRPDGSFTIFDDGAITNYNDAKLGIIATTSGTWSIVTNVSLERKNWDEQHPYGSRIFVPTPQPNQLVVRLDLNLPTPEYSVISLATRPPTLEVGNSSLQYAKQ